MIDNKNDYHIKILIKKRDLKFFWLFLKTIKLENEIKSLISGGYWTSADILLSKHKSFFTTILMRRKQDRTSYLPQLRGLTGDRHGGKGPLRHIMWAQRKIILYLPLESTYLPLPCFLPSSSILSQNSHFSFYKGLTIFNF